MRPEGDLEAHSDGHTIVVLRETDHGRWLDMRDHQEELRRV
jgi:hypothetical protein